MGTSTIDLGQFLHERDRWKVRWSGAHFVGFAMNDIHGVPTLALGNLVCLTDGVEPPRLPGGRFVDEKDAVAISVPVAEEELPDLMAAMGQGRLSRPVLAHFGRSVTLPNREVGKQEAWSIGFRTYGREFPRVSAVRNGPGELHKFFGYECIERARGVLLSSSQGLVYDGLSDLARQLRLESTHEFSNSSGAVMEVVAPVPVRMVAFKYDRVGRGYRIELECGTSVDRSRGLVSLVPGPRMRLPLDKLEEVRSRNGLCVLRGLFPAPRSDEKVKAAVILEEEVLFEEAVEGLSNLSVLGRLHGKPREEWAKKLEDLFDRSSGELQRSVTALAGPMSSRVMGRARDAVELLSSRPFYSIVAAASVVEALLRLRIHRYGSTRANRDLRAAGGRALSGAPRRLMLAECIEVAQRLGLIHQLDTHAARVLRDSRNFIHIELGARRHPEYSEAEAVEAFLAVLRVVDSLSRRRRRRRGTPRTALGAAGTSTPGP